MMSARVTSTLYQVWYDRDMRCLLICSLLVISNSVFAQSEDIFVDEPAEQRPEQEPGAYPDGYPQAYPPTCSPPCPTGYSCQEGACELDAAVPPAQTPPPGVVQPQPQPVAQPVNDPRYASAARRKGIIGFVGVGLVLGLGLSSAATSSNDDQIPSLPLGVATIAVHIIMGMVSAGGGRAARRGGGRGVVGLRIAGWITWALALVGGISLAALGASDVDVNAGPIIGVTALSAVSLICFGIDGIVGAGQARRAATQASARFAPLLYAAPNVDGGMTGMFGVNAAW